MTTRPLPILTQRECGRCSACCTALATEEPDDATGPGTKQAGKDCRFLRPTSAKPCGVYDQRPAMCRDFRCVWAAGALGVADRPDKSGLVLTIQTSDTKFRPDGPQHALLATEVWAGAARTTGAHVIKSLADTTLVFVQRRDGTRYLEGPMALVQQVAAYLKSTEQESDHGPKV